MVENDDTPNKETKLYVEQELSCLNQNCANYNTVAATIRSELPIG